MYHINKEITGSGENIALKNTARHYFKSFDILGNSVQEGTPSIEHESTIESVGDNIQLFDKNNANILNGYLDNNNLIFAENPNRKTLYIYCEPNKTYTVTKPVSGRFTVATSIEKPSTNMKFTKATNNNTAKIITITSGTEDKYLAVWYYDSEGSKTEQEILDNIKIEPGSKATLYSPYGQGSIEIKQVNKNFLDLTKKPYSESSSVLNGANVTANGGLLNVDATNSTGTVTLRSTWANYNDSSTILLPKGTYHTNVKLNLTNTKSLVSKQVSEGTFTIEENHYLTQWFLQVAKGNKATIILQIEKGSTATDYVEHQSQTKALYTQQPFRAIGDVKDRFIKQNDVWYEHHNINRYIFTGNEIFVQGTNGKQLTYFYSTWLKDYLSNDNFLSNNFKNEKSLWDISEYQDLFNLSSNSQTVNFMSKTIRTVDEFKAKLTELYEAGKPMYVDYVLAEPKLIPCTPEQVEQLEEIEKEMYSYDEVTNIYSTDKISPYFDVIAYQRISEEFKTRLKEGKITRGYLKVLATDTLPEIIIDENNYLKDLKIEELRYVPEEGFIGGAVAKRVSGNFNNVDNSFDIQDREVEVYLGVELEDETTEYIKYGTYIVQRPEDDQVTDNTSFEALDYMVKFNQEYKDRITYPCKLKELLNDVLDQAGVNSKTNTFANSDFIVENNQFEQSTTLRDVIKAITQMAFNWARIDEDDNFVMDFEINEEIDEELGTDDYFGFKKTDDYGPVNVIVLRNSQIEGENVTIKDEELINLPTNKNICPNDWIYGQYAPLDGSIGIYENRIRQKKLLKVKPNTEYYLNTFNDDYEIIIRTFLKDKTFSRNIGTLTPFMTNSEEYYIGVTIYSLSDNISALLELVNDNTIKPFICLNSEEDKTYIPFKAVGEIEYVIADNPFAYTELKRKQLIEAGRRLFGLRYTPMTVDMLGLMYLNAKDRISVENLNGEKFNTYLLDHTIDYTGIVLDSMQSQAKTKTETKYQYISPLSQGLSHVEIKVDKANKKIESIVQTQEEVSEKVAKTVARIEVVYALSDSSTVAPTDGWSTTAPEWTAGKYMWQKTITTYANGTTAETAATNISGAKGEAGQNGIGITQTNITYQKSTSGTTVPTGTWQTTIPEVDENGYLWTRTEFIYSDGSKKYVYNVGKKGATGIGVKSLVDQYYLSTSNTEQTGGEWTETQPQWEEGNYIWTRTKITWTNDSITYTDPILANTLNNINSNIVVLQTFQSTQTATNKAITDSVSTVTTRLNNDYLTEKEVNSKIDGLDKEYEILEERVAQTELTAEGFKIQIDTINNQGVDKITTSIGYTFNDSGLNINRDNADTGTIVNETGIQVLDKTGAEETPLLYAGYVKEGNTNFPDYEGQTIVATSNLIVKNFLVIGSNSRFQDYENLTLGGQGTGAFEI